MVPGVEMERANEEIENSCLFSDNPLVLYLPGTGEGIIGILAGKIAEKYSVPCFVFTDTEGLDFVKGSGRNPSGDIHLKNLLDKISAKMRRKIPEHRTGLCGMEAIREQRL